MSDDWQPGDLALCVNGSDCPIFGPTGLVEGRIYTVVAVHSGACESTGYKETGLRVLEHGKWNRTDGRDWRAWYNAVIFVKAPNHTPDAEDAETIRLLNDKPARVPA